MQKRRSVVAAVAASRVWRTRPLLIPAVAAAVVVVDQLSKTWAENHLRSPRHLAGPLNLTYTLNSGAAFSLGTGVTPIVEIVVVGLVVWLLAMSRRASRNASAVTVVGLGLLLGGALGNLGDRLFRHHGGAVVDFIQAVSWWPVFNVADASIVVGVIILVLTYSLRR